MKTLASVLNLLSAGAAFIAAFLWFGASAATVRSDYTGDPPEGVTYVNFNGARGPVEIRKGGKRVDVVSTLSLQGKLNAAAAAAAAVAALLQGAALLLPASV